MSNLKTKNLEGKLLKKTRDKLKRLNANGYIEVSFHTGIPETWLKRVAHGNIKDPSVNRIQKVFEYLTKKKLC